MSSGVACSAVSVEDLLSGINISCESRGCGNAESDGTGGGNWNDTDADGDGVGDCTDSCQGEDASACDANGDGCLDDADGAAEEAETEVRFKVRLPRSVIRDGRAAAFAWLDAAPMSAQSSRDPWGWGAATRVMPRWS